MTGKLKIIFLTLLVLSVAAAAQASPLFPFALGYTATYSCSQATNTWTAKLQVAGTTNLDGYQWWIVNMININGDGKVKSKDLRVTENALYAYDESGGPHFQTGPVNSQWTYTDQNGLQTATIVDITSVTVPAGTFNNVYIVYYLNPDPAYDHHEYQYWKPGVGLIKDVDYSEGYATNPLTLELDSFTLGAKTASLELLLPDN
jgi:hypothetical protein